MINLSEFLEKIHLGYDNKSYASLLGTWLNPVKDEEVMSDQYKLVKQFIEHSQGIADCQMEDIYFSINSFRHSKRATNETWHLNAFVIDYDFYKDKRYKKLSAEEMYEKHIKETLKFEPTFVVDSGRGLYVIYTFHHCSRVRIDLYKQIYKYLIKDQIKFGADQKVSLVTQVIRLPGTINSKSGTLVKVIKSNSTEYQMTDFATILPYTRQETIDFKETLKELKQKQRVKAEKRKRRSVRKVDYFHNVYQDLKTLIRIRNTDGVREGYREYVLFLCQYMARYYGYNVKESINYAHKLNNLFLQPMTDKEVEVQCKPSKILSGIMGINKIIERLDITEDEQQQLITLVSEAKRYQKQKAKKSKRSNRFAGLTEKQFELHLRRDSIVKLRGQGYSNSEIAVKLKISKQLLSKDMNYIKEHLNEFVEKVQDIMQVIREMIRGDNYTRYLSQTLFKILTEWLKLSEIQLE